MCAGYNYSISNVTEDAMSDPKKKGCRGHRGATHPCAINSAAQIARAKRLLEDAPTVERLVPGTFQRIADETGLSVRTVQHLREGSRWASVPPAPRNPNALRGATLSNLQLPDPSLVRHAFALGDETQSIIWRWSREPAMVHDLFTGTPYILLAFYCLPAADIEYALRTGTWAPDTLKRGSVSPSLRRDDWAAANRAWAVNTNEFCRIQVVPSA